MSKRLNRVSQLLKREISKIIQYDLKDPSINFVTVTYVKVNSDLSLAKVYVSIMEDDKKKEETLNAINRAASFIRRLLAGRISIRNMPYLRFYEDEMVSKRQRLEKLFEEINKERKRKGDYQQD